MYHTVHKCVAIAKVIPCDVVRCDSRAHSDQQDCNYPRKPIVVTQPLSLSDLVSDRLLESWSLSSALLLDRLDALSL